MQIHQPSNTVSHFVEAFDANLREEFEERAAIMEYDANVDRGHAECLATLEVLRRHPDVGYGITVIKAELDGATQWFVTTDRSLAGQHLAYIGAMNIEVMDLVEVIEDQYEGIAMLSSLG
jgi:hypothetical protein